MDNKTALSSMAMDLKRAALGWHRKSNVMANRFFQEALKRKKEINEEQLLQYIKDLLTKLEKNDQILDIEDKAENFLMYSTLIQNFVLYK